jgi:hydroxymethylglutaryl-CoA lyase
MGTGSLRKLEMKLPSHVHIVEVGPRDGLQTEAEFIPTAAKIDLVNALSGTGLAKIEVTSFVHPRTIPQLRDAREVLSAIERKGGVTYSVLVPNLRGAEMALEVGVDEMRIPVCASETFNQKNVRMSIAESLQAIEGIRKISQPAGIPLDVGVALAFGCPFEGKISTEQVTSIVGRLCDLGVTRVSITDPAGIANPIQVKDLISTLLAAFPKVEFSLHLHDTRGMALSSILAALEAGLTTFDSSIGGLGGCPFVPDATGNVVTEDLVNMLEEMGIQTGVDLGKLIECSQLAQKLVGRPLVSRILRAGTRQQLFQAHSTHP